MWTSYEAICELGGPVGSSDEADDPNSIFGVEAPALSPRNMNAIAGEKLYPTIPFKVGKSNKNATKSDEEPEQESFTLNNRFGTPSTPYSTFDKMTIGINHASTNSQFTSSKGRTSDIHNHLNRPATGSTVAPRSRASGETVLPQTNLFNVTPAVAAQSFRSPILETPAVAIETPGSKAAPASAIGYADQVLIQARRVAAGLYYETSPEAINPRMKTPQTENTNNRSRNIFDSRFNDMSAIPDTTAMGTHLSFATNLPTTPNVAPSPFHAGVSSVKGEKRALSPMELESRKKPGQEKDKLHDGAKDEAVPDHFYEGEYELDSETERNSIGKVLQLLSTLGAAYKYLCQVSTLFGVVSCRSSIHPL
jgi:hypothetical protein